MNLQPLGLEPRALPLSYKWQMLSNGTNQNILLGVADGGVGNSSVLLGLQTWHTGFESTRPLLDGVATVSS